MAETVVVLSMKEHAAGTTIAVTHPPCKDCAKHLAAAGVAKVIWRHCPEIEGRFDTLRSEQIFAESGVEIEVLRDADSKSKADARR